MPRPDSSHGSSTHPRKPIIALAPHGWNGLWRNRQHILSRLAQRGWHITFSQGPANIWQRGTSTWANTPLLDSFETTPENVNIHTAGRLLCRWPKYGSLDRLMISYYARRLHRYADSKSDKIVCVYHPIFWPLVELMRPRWLVYYAFDNYRAMGRDNETDIIQAENALVSQANLVVGTTDSIVQELDTKSGQSKHILPNGTDFAAMSNAIDKIPGPLAAIPSPRIAYCGALNWKVDYATIAEVATQKPDWHWVLLGPVVQPDSSVALPEQRQAWQRCQNLPNIHVLPPVPYPDIPHYLNAMDVNVICNRTDAGWWQDSYPLKFHDYLATGRPVVLSPIKSLYRFQDVAAFAKNNASWIDALDHAIFRGGVGTPRERREVAQQHDWNVHTDTFEGWLTELIRDQNRA